MNWNRPGDISGALPISVQLFKGNAGLVEASTLKRAPGVLVNENWKEPFVSITKFAMVGAARAGVVILIMRLRLGMPLTNMVARAWPIGKFDIGRET